MAYAQGAGMVSQISHMLESTTGAILQGTIFQGLYLGGGHWGNFPQGAISRGGGNFRGDFDPQESSVRF